MSKAGVSIKKRGLALVHNQLALATGIHNGESLGKTTKSVIKEAKRPASGAMTSQKMAEGELGTIRVPRVRNARMCLNVGMINAGYANRGTQPVIVFRPVLGKRIDCFCLCTHHKRELNLNSCVLQVEANRPIVKGPHFSFNMWNIRGFSCQSSKSTVLLYASAT